MIVGLWTVVTCLSVLTAMLMKKIPGIKKMM